MSVRDNFNSVQTEGWISNLSATAIGALFGLANATVGAAAELIASISSNITASQRQLRADEIFGGHQILMELDNFLRDSSIYIGVELGAIFLTFSQNGQEDFRLMRGNESPSEGTDYIIRRVQTESGWEEL